MTDAMTQDNREYRWPFWPLLPIYPYNRRRTLRREIIPNRIWVFEQIQGIFYVVTPVRMTVIRLQSGGLFVYAPVAPTTECIAQLRELEQSFGAVKYIILPTSSGLEHKVFVGPFARRCPEAQIFVSPKQWSFPINLPLSWLGLPGQRTHRLPDQSVDSPFGNEFDYAILDPVDLNLGYFQETAMVHRETKTLLVTDCIVSIATEPPDVVQVEPYPLLFHAKNQASDDIEDTPLKRRLGWKRVALFSFYFRPSSLKVKGIRQTLKEAGTARDRSSKNYFGLYPFDWQKNWEQAFEKLSGGGRLLVAPILQTLILNRQPRDVLKWVDQIAQWEIEQIIPCHLNAPVAATGADVKQAFSFLSKRPELFPDPSQLGTPLPAEDMKYMQSLDDVLKRTRITPPPQDNV